MAERYRLLKDMPGAKAGTVFTSGSVWLYLSFAQDHEWFEPVEDRSAAGTESAPETREPVTTEKYRLLKDAFDAKAGAIFQRMTGPEERWICHARGLTVSAAAIRDTEWFEPVNERWKPQNDEIFFWISDEIKVDSSNWNGGKRDRALYYAHNCFRTLASAEMAAYRIREFLMQSQRDLSQKLVP